MYSFMGWSDKCRYTRRYRKGAGKLSVLYSQILERQSASSGYKGEVAIEKMSQNGV